MSNEPAAGRVSSVPFSWHISALPPGVPYEQLQFHALMTENGVLSPSPGEAAGTASRLREAIVARAVLTTPR